MNIIVGIMDQCDTYIDHQAYVGQWPIFYSPVILLHILKTIWWRKVVLGIMDHCNSKINFVNYMWVSDLYFMVHWFYLISLSDKLFLYIKKWHRLGVFVPLQALALVFRFDSLVPNFADIFESMKATSWVHSYLYACYILCSTNMYY